MREPAYWPMHEGPERLATYLKIPLNSTTTMSILVENDELVTETPWELEEDNGYE